MIDQLIIFQKLYDLYLYTHRMVARFPKAQRFLLSNALLKTNMEMIRLTVIANSKPDRRKEQRQISVNLDLFRVYVRVAKDVGFLSIKRYGVVAEKVNEIGRLLNAWMKVSKS